MKVPVFLLIMEDIDKKDQKSNGSTDWVWVMHEQNRIEKHAISSNFTEVCAACLLFLTTPVTVAATERSLYI